MSENDTYDNSDSDCDDRHGSKTLSPTSSPFSHGQGQSAYSGTEKLQLCIDYWSEDKDGKQSAKETLRSIEFTPLKQSIKVRLC